MRFDMACDTGNTQPSNTGVLISVQHPAEGRAWLATMHPIKQLSHCVFWMRISSCPARAHISTAPRSCHSAMIFVRISTASATFLTICAGMQHKAVQVNAGSAHYPGRKSKLVDGKRLQSQKARLR